MTDDALTLTLSPAPDTTPIPDGVTLYPADDGDGVVRLFAVTSDGVVHSLTPAPDVLPEVVAPPSVTLRTPGYDALTHTHRPLVSGQHVAMFLGRADGREVNVSLRMAASIAHGWSEIAIGVRASPALGNVRVRYVAAIDVTTELSTYAPGTFGVGLTIPQQPPGTELYLVVATWSPPGWPSPTLIGPSWSDPIGSGLVGVMDGDGGATRPSAIIANQWPLEVVFEARPGVRPITAVVDVG